MRKSIIALAIIACFVLLVVPAFAGGCCGGAGKATPGKSVSCPMNGASKDCPMKSSGTCPMTGSKKGSCSACDKAAGKTAAAVKAPKKVVSAVCPVMGTKIPDVTKAAGKSVYKGKTYYFCCPGCKPLFDKNPAKYVNKKK